MGNYIFSNYETETQVQKIQMLLFEFDDLSTGKYLIPISSLTEDIQEHLIIFLNIGANVKMRCFSLKTTDENELIPIWTVFGQTEDEPCKNWQESTTIFDTHYVTLKNQIIFHKDSIKIIHNDILNYNKYEIKETLKISALVCFTNPKIYDEIIKQIVWEEILGG